MTGRSVLHAIAVIATLTLAITWSSTSPSLDIVRGSALLVVVLYLFFVLVTIAVENFRRPPSSSGDLWDDELDDGFSEDPVLKNSTQPD